MNIVMLIELNGIRLIFILCFESFLYSIELNLMLIENIVSSSVMMF